MLARKQEKEALNEITENSYSNIYVIT